jgi:CheY-like chemotaxis protein
VGRHGGVIQVDSTPGKGSAFRIYLPMTSASTGAAPEQIIHACIRGTERILIVDDETELLNLAAEILSELGYAVTTASKADKALTLFMERPQDFDLAILDQVMPRMTGATLAQHLLAIRPDLPILLCSGFSEAVSPPILESMGIRSYLMKPFTRSQLAGAVRRLLD